MTRVYSTSNKTFSILVCGQLARRWRKTTIVWEAAPAACAAVICFASDIGSTNVLEFEHHREVSSVSGEVILSHRGDATCICPITGQHSLPRNSDTPIAIHSPYGLSSPLLPGSATGLSCSVEVT